MLMITGASVCLSVCRCAFQGNDSGLWESNKWRKTRWGMCVWQICFHKTYSKPAVCDAEMLQMDHLKKCPLGPKTSVKVWVKNMFFFFCLMFELHNTEWCKFETRKLFSQSPAEGGKFTEKFSLRLQMCSYEHDDFTQIVWSQSGTSFRLTSRIYKPLSLHIHWKLTFQWSRRHLVSHS